VRLVYVPADRARILEETWDVSGLVGTGSHDFSIDGVFVPDRYTWPLGPGMTLGRHYDGPLYRFPLVGLYRLPVSAVAKEMLNAIRLSRTTRAEDASG
jgi:indole-3-acetate monooxygenase